jgi:hypothetical protein
MANFKSDTIDAVSTYSYIPTGGIITIAGPYSEYSDASYITLGLIPCDGRALFRTSYANLWNTFGTTFSNTTMTTGSTTVSGLTGMDSATHVGWGISGSGIPSGVTISSVTNSTTVVISQAATASRAGSGSHAISPYGFTGAVNSSTFNVPDLVTNKLTIVGTSSTFYNTNTVGTTLTSYNHSHAVSMTNNSFSMNAANVTHSHNYNFNDIGGLSDANHAHNPSANVGSMGGSQKNGPAGTAGGGLIGNHTHNFGVNANTFGAVGGAAHSHGAAINGNSGNAGDASHTHASSTTSAANSGSHTISGTSPDPILIPYANVLYFIKA